MKQESLVSKSWAGLSGLTSYFSKK